MFLNQRIGTRGRARARAAAQACAADEGYAAIDAIVALMIISFTIIAGLAAMDQAGRASKTAVEVQDARMLLGRLADSEPKVLAGTGGQTAAFAWTVQTAPTGDTALIDVCLRTVKLLARASGRAYGLTTLVTCPPKAET